MTSFDLEGGRLNYRIVGVAIHDQKILIHQELGEEFWTLPGGRCEILETARDTLARETVEELGVECEVGDLLWVVENFFDREGKKWHEIAFYFRITFPSSDPVWDHAVPFKGVEKGTDLTFRWVPLSELRDWNLVPEFLKDALTDLPTSIQHRVWTDASERAVRVASHPE